MFIALRNLIKRLKNKQLLEHRVSCFHHHGIQRKYFPVQCAESSDYGEYSNSGIFLGFPETDESYRNRIIKAITNSEKVIL